MDRKPLNSCVPEEINYTNIIIINSLVYNECT